MTNRRLPNFTSRKSKGFVVVGVLTLLCTTISCGGKARVANVTEVPAVPSGKPSGTRIMFLHGTEPGSDWTDLAPLRAAVGNARVLALGEPAHGVHEPLALRNHLIEYLVKELGFTAIAVEAAFPESRRLADYVAGGPGNVEEIVGEYRSWSSEPLEENLQLVRWLRAYNSDPRNAHPVHFYAVDLSYTGPWGSRPTPAALNVALAYLRRADSTSAESFDATFAPWLQRLADPTLSLTKPEHDTLTAAIDDLVAQLERERVSYIHTTNAADFTWAHWAAVVAQQTDRMFRVIPTEPPGDGVPRSAWRMVNARDSAMAQNVYRALQEEGPTGRLLVVAHNAHVQGAPTSGGPWASFERVPTSMGQHLRATFGGDLVIVGMSEKAATHMPLPPNAFDVLAVVDSLSPARPLRSPR